MTRDEISTRMEAFWMDVVASVNAETTAKAQRGILDELTNACISTLASSVLTYIKPEFQDGAADRIADVLKRRIREKGPAVEAIKRRHRQ
jgi:flavoprotein